MNQSSFYLTGVCLIPLALLITIAGLYLFARRVQRKNQEELKRLRGEVRRLHSSRLQIEQASQDYSESEPEPYGSRAANLLRQLEQCADQAAYLERQLVMMHEKSSELASNRMRQVMGAPLYWLAQRRDFTGLEQGLENAWQCLEAAHMLEQALEMTEWEVARQARQVRQLQAQVGRYLEMLRALNVQGASFEAAWQRLQQAQAELSKIPAYFLDSEEQEVLEKADKDSTVAAYAILAKTRPQLAQLLGRAQAWEKAYHQASDRISILGSLLEELRQALDAAPPYLDVSAHRSQLDGLLVIHKSLQDTLRRIEVESISEATQVAEQDAQIAQQAAGEVERARRELAALEAQEIQLSSDLKGLSVQFAALSTRATYPLAWRQSMDRLTDLNRQANTLGPPGMKRTPGQVAAHLALVKTLTAQQSEVAQRYQQVAQAHAQWVGFLEGPPLGQADDWLPKTKKLAQHAAEYSAENWPRMDSVGSLLADVDNLAQDLQRVLPARADQPVAETEIFQYLEEARWLAEACEKLQARAANIETRLAELRNREKEAQEELEGAQAALSQIAFIVRSNAFLAQTATQEIERFQAGLQEQLDELAERRRGSVDKKARQAEAWIARIVTAANGWLEQLNREIQSISQGLSASIARLDAIAQLDEGAVAEARRQLSAGPAMGAGSRGARSTFLLDAVIPELKRLSDYWQACSAAAHRLQAVENPVLESYEQANYARVQARDALADLFGWLRQSGAWPPTTLSLEAERQEMDRLEAQWNRLKSSQMNAISLVRQLGDLSAGYQTLAQKLHQGAERAQREQAEIGRLEEEINDLELYWESQWRAYRDNPTASQEIRGLLDAFDGERTQLKRQSKQGAKTFNQVVQDLQGMQRKLKYFQAAIDENHALDATGRVLTRR